MLPLFSLLLTIFIIGLYFIFIFQINRATASFEEIQTELSEVQTKEELELEETILGYKRKVDDLFPILKEHQKPTEFFQFLEKFVHPEIYFSSFSMDLDTGNVLLKGVAENFKSLGQQILLFEKEPSIKRTELSSIFLIEEEKIKFDINILLTEDIVEPIED